MGKKQKRTFGLIISDDGDISAVNCDGQIYTLEGRRKTEAGLDLVVFTSNCPDCGAEFECNAMVTRLAADIRRVADRRRCRDCTDRMKPVGKVGVAINGI